MTIVLLEFVVDIFGYALWLIVSSAASYSTVEYERSAHAGVCMPSRECASLVDVVCDGPGLACCARTQIVAR